MYPYWDANAAVLLVTVACVGTAVLIHYEGLSLLSRQLALHREGRARRKVLYGICGVLLLHVAEIWVFGLGFWGLARVQNAGIVLGAQPLHLLDAVYLAAMSYTTVGSGDVVPVGPIRFLAGTVALTGFVMLTWSASFTYLEMERYWRR
ncbi:ion channel [Arenimonas fontis]|uniref:Two pore domain potassium channel family protein n=1 Tax=Arenimonas fontis TaxID=2608255 RepID=A0A5B2ZEH1_9GAMM|nr:ion channel [Arenimonas fontis]KAA2286305.1 two pore domain potassium channel family protein [Arenimonas fontis]